MRKLTQEFVEKEFNRNGYKLKDSYKGNNIPMLCLKNGYMGYMSYVGLQSNKKMCLFGFNNPYWKDNVKTCILNKYGDIDIISIDKIAKSHKNRILITFRCECGEISKKLFDYNRQKDKYFLCRKCMIKKRGSNHRKDINVCLDYFKKRGYTLINPPDTFTRTDMLLAIDKNGYIGKINYNKLKSGRNIGVFTKSNKDNYIANVNTYCKLHGIPITALGFSENQRWSRVGIKFKCTCGNTFETSISSFQNGKTQCDKCAKSISRFELYTKTFLEKNNINYIYQYCFNSCRDILPLPFDFYLKDYKKIIEVDGQQHFKPVKFANITDNEAILQFEYVKKHDYIKNEFCKKNNIELLRISYKDFVDGSYKEKIIQFIKE